MRIGFVYLAWFLLWSGRAYGGKNELLALEHVRLDAADGSLDGTLNKERVKNNLNQKASGATTEAEYRAATMSARRLYGAAPKHGGALKYFMVYDAIVLSCCALGYGWLIVSNHYFRWGLHMNTFMFSVTLFFSKVTYAFLSAPFLIFAAPILGPGLTGARETAYDRSGHCVPQLNKMQLKEKYDFEKTNKHKMFDFDQKERSMMF